MKRVRTAKPATEGATPPGPIVVTWSLTPVAHDSKWCAAASLLRFRSRHKLSRRDAAAKIGLSRRKIRRIEAMKDRLRLDTITTLSLGIGVSVRDLLEGRPL